MSKPKDIKLSLSQHLALQGLRRQFNDIDRQWTLVLVEAGVPNDDPNWRIDLEAGVVSYQEPPAVDTTE